MPGTCYLHTSDDGATFIDTGFDPAQITEVDFLPGPVGYFYNGGAALPVEAGATSARFTVPSPWSLIFGHARPDATSAIVYTGTPPTELGTVDVVYSNPPPADGGGDDGGLLTLVADDFDRADGPLGETSVGNVPWVPAKYSDASPTPTWEVQGGKARVTADWGIAVVETGVADCEVSVECDFVTAGEGLVLRRDPINRTYLMLLAGNVYGAGPGGINSNMGAFEAPATGDILKVAMVGPLLTVYINDFQVGEFDVTPYQTGTEFETGTEHGLYTDASGGFDLFSVATSGGSGGGVPAVGGAVTPVGGTLTVVP